MRILVTGGAGYVGSVLVPELLDRGHFVRVIDTLNSGGRGLLTCARQNKFEFRLADIGDRVQLKSALDSIDCIIHLAAVVGYPACARNPRLAEITNVDGVSQLLEFRHPMQRIIFASTCSVYGSVPSGICSEKTSLNPVSLYGLTKLAGEKLLRQEENCIILRLATAFGVSPQMRFDLLPNSFAYQAANNGALVVYEGSARRCFVHVRDIAGAMIHAVEGGFLADEVYNVGDESLNVSKRQLANLVHNYTGCYLHFADYESDTDQRNYDISYNRLHGAGFRTTVNLTDGMAELVVASYLAGKDNSHTI